MANENVGDRRTIYSKVWEQAAHDLSIIYGPGKYRGLSARVQGFVPVPDGLIRAHGIGMH